MPLYHLWTRQEVLEFAKLSNFDEGLSSTEAAKRLLANGLNEIKPKERAVIWKILSLLFGGFNAVLYVASLITWIAWRPLGDPNPAPANLGKKRSCFE